MAHDLLARHLQLTHALHNIYVETTHLYYKSTDSTDAAQRLSNEDCTLVFPVTGKIACNNASKYAITFTVCMPGIRQQYKLAFNKQASPRMK